VLRKWYSATDTHTYCTISHEPRAWADGDFDADHGLSLDGVGHSARARSAQPFEPGARSQRRRRRLCARPCCACAWASVRQQGQNKIASVAWTALDPVKTRRSGKDDGRTNTDDLLAFDVILELNFGFGVDPERLCGYPLAHLADTWWCTWDTRFSSSQMSLFFSRSMIQQQRLAYSFSPFAYRQLKTVAGCPLRPVDSSTRLLLISRPDLRFGIAPSTSPIDCSYSALPESAVEMHLLHSLSCACLTASTCQSQ
jgi:hypothetical protein